MNTKTFLIIALTFAAHTLAAALTPTSAAQSPYAAAQLIKNYAASYRLDPDNKHYRNMEKTLLEQWCGCQALSDEYRSDCADCTTFCVLDGCYCPLALCGMFSLTGTVPVTQALCCAGACCATSSWLTLLAARACHECNRPHEAEHHD